MNNNEISLNIGTILHNGELPYRIDGVLGQGGFGITYLASGKFRVGNVWTEGKFAIKEHFPETCCFRQEDKVVVNGNKLSEFKRSKTDFIAEAKRLHDLGTENENIVKVNEIFEENQTAYYVMQYINGISLRQYVKARNRLTYTEALSVISPILDAVEFLHKSRINHLDIKPANIMLHEGTEGLVPILIDFGLSIHFKKNGEKTSIKGILGFSEGYSPLEQYAGVKEFNPATDIYALGATILYMLTGVTPKSAGDLKIMEVRNTLDKLVPENVVNALCKALNKSSEDRHQSVSAFKSELGLNNNSGSLTKTVLDKTVLDKTVIDKKSNEAKSKLPIIYSAVILAAIVLGAFYFINNKLRDSESPTPADEAPTITTEVPTYSEDIPEEKIEEEAIPIDEEEGVTSEEQKDGEEVISVDKEDEAVTPTHKEEETVRKNPKKDDSVASKETNGTLSLGYATYEGKIKNGKPHGKGRLTFKATHRVDGRPYSPEAQSGQYFEGIFENGNVVSGKLYESDGTLIKTWIP